MGLNIFVLYVKIKKTLGSINMSGINSVLKGKYEGEPLSAYSSNLYLPYIDHNYPLTTHTISSYTVMDTFNKTQTVCENALFSGSYIVVNKKEYLISLEWKDGGKSLILINDKYYKIFVSSMF